jgi:hypothetical protein
MMTAPTSQTSAATGDTAPTAAEHAPARGGDEDRGKPADAGRGTSPLAGAPDIVNPCPAKCGRQVNPGDMLCPACWHRVPHGLVTRVRAAWRDYQREPSDRRWDAYHEARLVAISQVRRM